MSEPTLLERTLTLLRDDPRTLAQLARDTGMNYFWLRNLKIGRVKSPGVNRVENLNKFLRNAR